MKEHQRKKGTNKNMYFFIIVDFIFAVFLVLFRTQNNFNLKSTDVIQEAFLGALIITLLPRSSKNILKVRIMIFDLGILCYIGVGLLFFVGFSLSANEIYQTSWENSALGPAYLVGLSNLFAGLLFAILLNVFRTEKEITSIERNKDYAKEKKK